MLFHVSSSLNNDAVCLLKIATPDIAAPKIVAVKPGIKPIY